MPYKSKQENYSCPGCVEAHMLRDYTKSHIKLRCNFSHFTYRCKNASKRRRLRQKHKRNKRFAHQLLVLSLPLITMVVLDISDFRFAVINPAVGGGSSGGPASGLNVKENGPTLVLRTTIIKADCTTLANLTVLTVC